jgi:predicted phage terminase large subunit-like protein
MRVVVIMTRWHENDLAGRLLEAQAHDWRVVRLPAMAEDNDALGRKPGEMLWGDDPKWPWAQEARAIKSEFDRSGASRTWSALYQQNPMPDTGSYFLRQWLVPVPSMPPVSALKVYGASDYAVTAAGGDYTVHVVVGMDADGRLWILDLWREQTTADEWVEAFCALVKRWKPLAWAEEGGQIKASVGPFLTRTMRERHAYVHRVDFPTRGDKAIRAQSIRGRMAVDGIRYLATAEWRGSFESEILSFPVGKHDDQCLIEGTLITMADGSRKPIEAVRVGDVVATHEGPCAVEACGVTDEAADVMQVAFSDGSVLTGTPNHPVFIVYDHRPGEFVSMGDLRLAKMVEVEGGYAVYVVGLRMLTEKARVLNLTVSRAHAFYANGVLTHNCDALGLVGQLLDRMEKPVAPKSVELIRGTMEMTMSEAWKLANPRTLGGKRVRI